MPIQLPLPGLLRPVELPRPVTGAAALHAYPDVPPDVLCTHAKKLGAAGESFTQSMLERWGETVLRLPENLPADLVVLRTRGFLTIQVKITTHPPRGAFVFPMHKGYRGNPDGMRPYAAGDYDIAALVVLSENVVRFVAGQYPAHRIPLAEIPGLRADPRASFAEALAQIDPADDPDPAVPLAAVA